MKIYHCEDKDMTVHMGGNKVFFDRKFILSATLSAIFLSLNIVIGKNIDVEYSAQLTQLTTYKDILLWFLFCFVGCLIMFPLFLKLANKIDLIFEKKGNRIYMLTFWGIIIITWIPLILACYPGFLVYDGVGQEIQYLMGDFNNRHSVLMTWIMGSLIKIGRSLCGGYNQGIFFFTIFQIFFLSFSLAYLCAYIRKRSFFLSLLLLIFSCCSFINAFMAFATTKDTLFTVFFIFAIVEFDKMIDNIDEYLSIKRNIFKLIIFNLIACLFTHNYYHAFIVTLICLVIIYRVHLWKRLLLVLILFLLGYQGYTGIFLKSLNVIPTDGKTKMCVPFQQIARVYNYRNDELSEEEKNSILEIWEKETLESYVPYCSDKLTVGISEPAYQNQKVHILKIWIRGLRFWDTYIDSFLINNYEFWYPAATYPQKGWNPEYFKCKSANLTEVLDLRNANDHVPADNYNTGNEPLCFRELYNIIVQFAEHYGNWDTEDAPFQIPVLLGMGLYFIIFILILIISFVYRKNIIIKKMMPAIFLMFTYLCGPAAIMRYMYPIMISVFLYMGILVKELRECQLLSFDINWKSGVEKDKNYNNSGD